MVLRHLNLLPQNPTPAPEISQIEPWCAFLYVSIVVCLSLWPAWHCFSVVWCCRVKMLKTTINFTPTMISHTNCSELRSTRFRWKRRLVESGAVPPSLLLSVCVVLVYCSSSGAVGAWEHWEYRDSGQYTYAAWHPQLRTGGFYYNRVSLATCLCWQQLAHSV